MNASRTWTDFHINIIVRSVLSNSDRDLNKQTRVHLQYSQVKKQEEHRLKSFRFRYDGTMLGTVSSWNYSIFVSVLVREAARKVLFLVDRTTKRGGG